MKNILLRVLVLLPLLTLGGITYSQVSYSGSETRVNTTTANDQIEPAVSMDSAGNYIVVWASLINDGSDYGVYYQRFDNTGTPIGSETLVNNTTDYGQRKPDIAATIGGGFVIVWESYLEDGDGHGVWFALYDNTGTLVQRNRVNDSLADEQTDPVVAMDYDGGFVVGYTDDGQDGDGAAVSFQPFNSSGIAQIAEGVVNTTTAGYQGLPDVAMDSAGNFCWVWQGDGTDGLEIFGRRYDDSYSAIGSEFQINSTTAGNQQEPSIAMARDGSFLVCWSSMDQDGDHFGIYGQLYNSSGATVGSEFIINSTTAGTQDNVDVSVDYDGKYMVTWTSFDQDGDKAGVYLQVLNTDGSLWGSEFQVNTRTNDYQQLPAVASHYSEDDIVVVWQDGLRFSSSTHDGDDYGIYMQRFSVVDVTPPTAVCQNITVYLDGTGNVSITAADVDGGSTDNVGITSYSINTSAFTCSEIGANTVTLTVEDAAGNSDNCNATVTVLDTVAPTASCQNLTVYLDGTGNASITAADVDNGSTDNCGSVTLSADITSFTCSEVGANTVTLTVTDGSSNTATCTSTVTVLDTVTPTAVCQNITAYLDGSGNATITGADLDNGSSDNCSSLTYSASQTAFTCSDIGANSITLTVTDAGSNTANCVSTVTIADTTSPTASCQNITVYLDGTGNATITAADIDNGSTDNCGSVTLSADITSFTCSEIGANTVTLTVTDGSSNTSTCTSTVTVLDTVAPTASCQNMTVYLDGSGNATITAGDIDNGSTDNCSSVTLSADITSFTCSDLGANTVTLTVTDGSSNTATCTSTVTVLDTVSPTASCQNMTAYLDASGNVSITAGDIDNGSTDNCTSVTLSADITSFTCSEIGANTVTLTVTDGSSNTSTCTSTVTVLDTVAPTASCQNINVYLDASGNATIAAADIDNGSTDACSSVTLAADITSFTCAEVGANTVTLTVTDGSGNTATCTSTVTVLDTISPTATCQNINAYLDASGNVTIAAADIDNGSTDACSAVTLSADITSFTCAELGANTVTLTVTDGSGNTATCTSTVTVLDTISPTASCQNITTYLDGSGNATITAADIDNGSTDACSAVTLSADITSFTCAEIGANTVTLTVTDGAGNSSTCTATVTVADTVAPVADVASLSDLTGECTVTATAPTATDNCDGAITATTTDPTTLTGEGTYTITWTYTDGAGNTSTQTQNVIIDDITAPVPDVATLSDVTDECSVTSLTDPTATDNCGGAVTVTNDATLPITTQGTTVVTWTYDDGNGNTSTQTQNVVIDDITAPVPDVATLSDVTDECSVTSLTDPTATDNCGGTVTVTNDATLPISTQGTTVVTWTYDDGNGNTSTQTQNVVIDDVTAPVVTCPGDQTENPNASCEFVLVDYTGLVTITDNCVASPTVTQNPAVGTLITGTTQVWLIGDDGNGNLDSCSFNVILNDATAPTAVCQDFDVYLDVTGNATINGVDLDGGSTDNCTGLTFSASQTAFDCTHLGVNTITLTVTDGNSNTATCTSDVTVIDSIVPVADVAPLADVTGECNVNVTAPTATDNCAGTVTATTVDPTTYNTEGTYTVNWTYDDGNGNTSTQTQTVIVDDVTAPSVTCAGDQTENPNANCEFTLIDYTGLATTTDNCSSTITVTQNPAVGTLITGTTQVWLIGDDGNGNLDSCSFNVILNDATAPTAVCQDIDVYLDVTGNATINGVDLDGGSTDNCTGLTFSASQTAFDCTHLGVNTITLTVTDGNSNTATCTSDVTVIDSIVPVADVAPLADVTGECNVNVTAPTATDNCAGTVTATTVDPTTYNTEGTYTVNWTYDDGNGNTSTQTQTVIVDDVTAPSVTCAGDQTENPNANCEFTLIDYTGLATTTDNCSSTITVTQNPAVGTLITGTTQVWLIGDDGNGNLDSCSFNVILSDAVAPTAVCQDITVYLDGTGNVNINDADLDGGSTDNCSGLTFAASQTAFSCADLGVVSVTLTVIDGNSNSATCTSDVTVMDTLAPVPDVATLADATGECSVTLTAPTATDNCSGAITATTVDPTTYNTQGTYTVTWTYDDGNGNTSTQTQTVIVDDVTPAVVTCPGDQSENPNANCEFTLLDYTGLVTTTDNCSASITVTQSPVAGTVITGNTTIWMIADDGNGNLDSCSFDVTLIDIVPPTVVCQDITVYLDGAGTVSIADTDIDGGSTDNCSGMTYSASQTDFYCFNLGVTNVTLTVTDGAGNSASCVAQVTVMDTISPVPDTATLADVYGECSASVTAPTATDNCSGSITATTTDPLSYSTQGTYTVNWSYDDGNGNVTVQTQTVIVSDTTAPSLACPGDATFDADPGTCGAIVTGLTPTGLSDNCTFPNNLSISYSLTGAMNGAGLGDIDGSNFSAGVTTVTYYVQDEAGNIDSCSFTVTVNDNEIPTIACSGDLTVPFDSVCSYTLPDLSWNAVVTDNCTPVITQSPAIGTLITSTTTITLTATDPSGNTATCSFDVIPGDSTAPVIDCIDTDVVYLDENCEVSLPDYAQILTINDNCDSNPVIVQSPAAGEMFTGVGSMEVWITAQDINGNTDSCLVNLSIEMDDNSGCQQSLIIADLLTPNGDGQNDTWKVKETQYIDGCTVSIYNRWGQKVYETTSYQNEWDGTKDGKNLPDGSYFYVIECDGEVTYKGPVTLMRLSK